ncbi:uncharacterized protein LOC8269364 [Ricinus communis]|uniref:uncharacterized protein LOC8269364 n=1 Tax=Ricinus communis TaxID=3988 RepID=UPI00201ADDD8|nr:uncharacterized protein LOC8269364 [Ricinus communis]
MFTKSSDLPHQESLQIKENDKFFSRLLSKEASMANPSFRVYYGGVTVAVPFMWESQPGTPKYSFCEATLPPLTPPPSYYSNSHKNPIKKRSRSNLLHILFSRINSKKTSTANVSTLLPSYSSSSTSSPTPSSASSWSSWYSTPSCRNYHERGRSRSRFSSCGSSFDSRALYDDQEFGSPTSTLCFRVSKGSRWP